MSKKKLIHANLYGMPGEGETKTAAKLDAVHKIVTALEGWYTPVMLVEDNFVALMYRTIEGWCYSIIDVAEPKRRPNRTVDAQSIMAPEASAVDVNRRMRNHLAQYLYENDRRETDEGSVRVITDDVSRNDHRRWMRWQRHYSDWKTIGASNEIAREGADSRTPPARPILQHRDTVRLTSLGTVIELPAMTQVYRIPKLDIAGEICVSIVGTLFEQATPELSIGYMRLPVYFIPE